MSGLRPIRVTPNYLKYPEGSCLFQMGHTQVVCTATLSRDLPDHAKAQNKGWLSAEWGKTAGNRRARYYRLTASGQKQLAREIQGYQRVAHAIARILQPA